MARNQSVTIPVTYTFTAMDTFDGTYAVQMQGIQWSSSAGGATTLVNFMANQPNWRTPFVMDTPSYSPYSAAIWEALNEYFKTH